jgi:large repetitive protein
MTWAHVQNKLVIATGGAATTATVAMTSSSTANNLMTVTVTPNANAVTSVTDSAGNTYTLAYSETATGSVASTVYYSQLTTGGTLTITVHFAGATVFGVSADEWSATTGTISIVAHNLAAAASTSPSSGNVTWTNNILLLGTMAWTGTPSFTVGTGFTSAANQTPVAGESNGLAVEYILNTTSSPTAATGTLSASASWAAIGIAFQSSGDTGTSLAVSPTQADPNLTGKSLTLTGTGTSWTPGTPGSPTFTASTGSITAQTVASTTSATLTYNTPAGPTTVTLTDPSTSDTALLTINSTLTSGTASTTSQGNTIATVTCTAATGGSGGYTYQWYRSTTSGFTPGGGNIVSGATSLTLNDTGLTNGTTYYYKLVSTDSDSQTVTSNQTSATPAAASLSVSPTSVVVNSTNQTLILTGVGTSWTTGTPGSPTFTVSGGTITAQTVNSTTSATLTYNAPSSTGSVTITDPSTSATTSLTISSSSLANGTASVVSVGSGTATVTVGNATGGVTPYSYQWYRSTTSGFTPGGGNIISGATTQTYVDTGLTNGTTYYYVNVVTDSS